MTDHSSDRDLDVDHYAVLGVGPTASADELAAAYRRQLRRLHPDTHAGDAGPESERVRALQEVLSAYAVLGDPVRRARYDRDRSARRAEYEPSTESSGTGPAPVRDDAVWLGWRPGPVDLGDVPLRAGPVRYQPDRRTHE